eukprot:74421-Prymnesium_polylepis.1
MASTSFSPTNCRPWRRAPSSRRGCPAAGTRPCSRGHARSRPSSCSRCHRAATAAARRRLPAPECGPSGRAQRLVCASSVPQQVASVPREPSHRRTHVLCSWGVRDMEGVYRNAHPWIDTVRVSPDPLSRGLLA